jgi:hypothetical protein
MDGGLEDKWLMDFSCYPFTATVVAQAFLHNVYKLHGLPATIISNRDRVLQVNFGKNYFKLIKSSYK